MADESLSRSSSNSLTNMLSKTSRRKKDSGSEGSVSSTIERLKGHTVTEEDIGENGLGKLLSKGLGRRRKKQQREEEQRAIEEAARGRSVADRGTLENELHDHRKSSPEHGDGETSSVVTYDSDTESAHATPPPLSTHPSHIGYLTTSSPLVKATTLPDTSSLAGLDAQLDEIATTPRASKFPPADTVAASESNPDPVPGSTLRAPTDGSHKRTASPVGRLKEALHPRRATSPKSSSSPERKAGGGGAAASIKEKEKSATADNRRGSVASRIGSIFPDRQSPHSSAASSPERPRTGKVSAIDTNIRPQTPPPADNTAPIIVNTPPTPTDTGSPRFSNQDSASPDSAVVNTNVVTSPSGNMISHRRIRSGSATALGPSKLSNITTAPLTPTLENAASPGQGGFFSSVFSAAQNAANTLSSSIANTSVAPDKARSRSGTQDLKEVESPVVETLGEKTNSEVPTEEKEPAVKTLGMGDLSLSHLGIAETASGGNTPIASKFGESHETRGRSESTMSEEAFANRAVAAAQGMGGDNMSRVTTSEVEDGQSLARPRSVYDTMPGEQTPPNGSVFEGKAGIHRSGSIRSAMGNRRKRGSSAATGHSTIGAAIAAANGALTRPAVTEGEPAKITGFAVASKKRNRDFHNLFRSVPDDDYLIEDYSCALQREILAHGRLYVSEGHLCFSSNIFGWVTTLVMSFDEIVSVEKRSTALLFKNGLMISTLHAKNVFASFTSRDSTYDLIVGIWKLGHPSLRSSLNGVRIEETGGGDKTEKDDGTAEKGSQSSGEESGSEDGEVYDEDDDTGDGDSDGESFVQAEGLAPSDAGEKVVSRKPSTGVVKTGTPAEKTKESTAPTAGLDFPGPATHAPTDCTDHDTHYDIILADEIIPAPLGKVYSLMFGQASLTWMKNWLTDDQKCLELTMDDQTKPLNMENKVRTYSYIKPLNGSIGPKQTKCLCSENLDSMDLDKAVSVTISTQTPDVPSGNVFSIKTKYCLSWAEGNGTRLQMNCTIEWTGKSWLKGPIEKGSKDGQIKFAKEIVASLKAAVSSRRGTTTPTAGAKGKKKGRKGRDAKGGLNKATDGASDAKAQSEDWGLAEPLRSIFGPLVDIIKPLLTGNILYGILVGLLVASWFGFGFTGRGGSGRGDLGFLGTPQRIAAYEEIWRKEESELWDWLEERVGMDRARETTKASFPRKDLEDRLKDEKMDDREVEAAIKVTEEKLRVLKGVVEKKKKKANLEKFGETYVQEKDAPENISQ